MPIRTLADAVRFGEIAGQYVRLRRDYPLMRAVTIKRYIDSDTYLQPEQFMCETELGHRFAYSGTAYGGDDDSYHGEGRAYCMHCGADGDA